MTASPRDRRHYEPRTEFDLMREFPEFHVWLDSTSGFRTWYARHYAIDAEKMGAEDLTALRDQIIKWNRIHEG